MTTPATGSNRTRGFPFFRRRYSLKALIGIVFVLAMVCAGVREIIDGHQDEQDALSQLAQLRVTVDARTERPRWLPRFVNQAYAKYFDRVVQLNLSRKLANEDEGYWQGPENFTDRDLPLLIKFTKLERLDVLNTGITEDSIHELARFKQLKALLINQSLNRTGAMRDFRKAHPNCRIGTGSMVVARLQADEIVMIANDRSSLQNILPLLRNATLAPSSFGFPNRLYVNVDSNLVGERREELIQRLTTAATASGYRNVQVSPPSL